MPRFDKLPDEALARQKAAIELEQKNRSLKQNGLDPSQFADIHNELGCEVVPVFIKTHKGKGALHYDVDPVFDYATDAYEYQDKCTKHNVSSASYRLLSPISTG